MLWLKFLWDQDRKAANEEIPDQSASNQEQSQSSDGSTKDEN